MKKKPKHREAAIVRAPELERLSLPVFVRKELAKMKAAGRWDGDPMDPGLDPAVTLSIIMVDDRNDPALRAACAKSLIPFIHEDKSLAFKAQASDAGGTVMVLVKRFSEGDGIPKGLTDQTPPPLDPPGTPTPLTPAAIDRTNASGAAIYSMPDSPSGRPVHATDAIGGFYEVQRAADGTERIVHVDHAPADRIFNGTPPEPKVEKDFDA